MTEHPSLFTTEELVAATAGTGPELAGGGAEYFVDLSDWLVAHKPENFPPDPQAFSAPTLAEHPGMGWLLGVDFNLVYPEHADEDGMRRQLDELVRELRSAAIVLPADFCPNFPAGYSEPLIALDTETTGLDLRIRYDQSGKLLRNTDMVGLCLAISPNRAHYLPIMHTGEDGIPNWPIHLIVELCDRIMDEFAVIFHNANYDREVLALAGCRAFRPYPYYFDTQIIDFFGATREKMHGLKGASERVLGRKMVEIQELFYGFGVKKKKDQVILFNRLPATSATVYGGSDAANTFGLFQHYAGQPEASNIFARQYIPLEIDGKTTDVIRQMTRVGMPVNFRYNFYAMKDAIYRTAAMETFLEKLIGRKLNYNSPPQMSKFLFVELGLRPIDEQGRDAKPGANGNYGTGEKILEKLFEMYPDNILLRYLVLYRKINTSVNKLFAKMLVNTYSDAMLPYTRAMLSFSITTAETGRLSSSSSKGCQRVTMNITDKTKKKTFAYNPGDGSIGMNSQGIPSGQFRQLKAKRIKALPPEAGIDLKALYPGWVDDAFLRSVAEA